VKISSLSPSPAEVPTLDEDRAEERDTGNYWHPEGDRKDAARVEVLVRRHGQRDLRADRRPCREESLSMALA
jgi:hypothetical protein